MVVVPSGPVIPVGLAPGCLGVAAALLGAQERLCEGLEAFFLQRMPRIGPRNPECVGAL